MRACGATSFHSSIEGAYRFGKGFVSEALDAERDFLRRERPIAFTVPGTITPPVADPVLSNSETVFTSPRFSLVRETFATGVGPVTRPVIHHPGAVAILAQPDPQHVVLVRQFRYPVRTWTLEIPAGTREAGETPVATARRELQEEVGFDCARLTEIMRFYPALGVSDEEMILYRAEGLTPCAAEPDHGELASRAVVPLADLAQHLAAGTICDAKTIIALALLGLPVTPVPVEQALVPSEQPHA
jgi:ADP-ribose pyrophosphatase